MGSKDLADQIAGLVMVYLKGQGDLVSRLVMGVIRGYYMDYRGD